MLYIGEEVGSGTGPGVDFARGSWEGTKSLAPQRQDGSMGPCWPLLTAGACSNAPDST